MVTRLGQEMTLLFLIFRLLLTFILFVGLDGQRTQWDAQNYPNPTSGDFMRCKMRSTSLLCDPDEVMSEQERYRVNYELGLLESSTRQEHGRSYCERKGITAAVAIARQVKGGQEQDVRNMANEMLRRWTLDRQCEKAIVVVLSVDDRRFWVARMQRVPVYAQEFTEIFKVEQGTFRAGRHAQGLQNVVRAIRDRALSKQVPVAAPDEDGRSKGKPFVPPPPQPPPAPKPSSGGGGLSWLIILIIIFFVVIPLVCCCCCIYFCCIRKKESASDNRTPQDPENGADSSRRGGGGFFRNLPIAAALGGIGSFFSKRRRGGGGGGTAGGDGGGSGPPPYSPVAQEDDKKEGEGKGLYPSAPVKDEGGGGTF